MKKTYEKPTLVRRQSLVQIAASAGGNGELVVFSIEPQR